MQGLIHISELSWTKVSTPEMVVQPGSVVRCKVISLDRSENKIGLSLKQMEADPLMETLESVLPAGEQPEFSEVPCDIPPSIEDICNSLKGEKGVEAVNLGRCAREKRAVSQVMLMPCCFATKGSQQARCRKTVLMAVNPLHQMAYKVVRCHTGKNC